MTSTHRWLLLGTALGFLGAVGASCGGGKPACNASTCGSGCCDANGACQPGGSNLYCGLGGAQCTACSLGQFCTLGLCTGGSGTGGGMGTGGGTATGGGGGSNTGGGGGSASCGPSNCAGCCDGSGACVPVSASGNNTTCGSLGAACVDCTANGQVCNPNLFTCQAGTGGGGGSTGGGGGSTGGGGGSTGGGGGSTGGGGGTSCNSSNCGGCCTTAGVCMGGTTNSACGSGAVTCAACSASQTCNGFMCVANTGGGSGGGGGTGTCTVSTSSFGSLGSVTTGQAQYDSTNNALAALVPLETTNPADALKVELYGGFGVFSGGTIAPGTYQLTGAELNYATCGVCLRVLTNTDSSTSMYEHDYLATGGTVTITTVGTAAGQQFTASLSNVTFGHVTIDSTTFQSTPAGDGCTSAISSASLNLTLQ